ncbi:MAG: LPS export ABC transporter periplasmic protein LptC, partial [Clostridiaceae bacterium]|nr:LPS export ABC transporter periplasmic protein LptC [Clostridiaceae bacterium]
KEWAFFADKIKYDEKKNNAYLTVVEGTKFNNESMQLQIWAETVKLDFISGKVFFEGNVKVISNKKIRFNTEKAVWDPRKKRFNAEGFIHYEGGTSEIFGSEMEIDSNLETAQIKGKVRFHSKIF